MKLISLMLAAAGWLLAAGAPESGIQLEVIEGDGAVYNVRGRAQTVPRVRVISADGGSPVAGAFVTFRLPDSGPAAVFSDGRIHTVSTAANGEASLPGVRPNSQLGAWTIQVSASYKGAVARAEIRQINAAPVNAISADGRKGRSKFWLVAAVAAAGAAAASFGVVGGGGSSIAARSGGVGAPSGAAASPPLSIGIGQGSIGTP